MMLPIIARAADVVLRRRARRAARGEPALGASRWRTVWHVVLPTARPGLATALILGVARGVGETCPVLLTSGAATFLVTNPTDGVMNSLPLFIYSTVRSGEPICDRRGLRRRHGAAVLVLVLFVDARRLAGRAPTRPRPSRCAVACHPPRTEDTAMNRRALRWPCWSLAAGAVPGDAPPARATGVRARSRAPGSTWSELIVQQWIADVDANGMQVVYTGGGSSKGRKDFAQDSTDFAITEIPYQGTDEPGNADTSNGRALRLPADRGGRHRVHLPAQGRRQAGPQPPAVRRDDRQDLHQPDHQLERPGDHQGQQRPRASRRCRSSRSCAPTAPAPRRSSRPGWTSSTRASGGRSTASPGSRRTTRARARGRSAQAGSDQVMNIVAELRRQRRRSATSSTPTR